jgi:hypothetical protein
MTRLTITLLAFLITSICVGQTASIKIERIYHDNSFKKFDSIIFIINGTRFIGNDTTIQTIKLNKNFDKCAAIVGRDTLKFLTRFQAKNTYIIQPGCCCTAFTLKADKNPRRGTVTFRNSTKKHLGLIVAEANIDTVSINSSKEIFSYESALCFFKPCSIMLVETEYMAGKYSYDNDNRDYDSLWKEKASHILTMGFFHFLHGEKIEIVYKEKAQTMHFNLKGYLTDDEYEKWLN